jgi:hypothetical protein
VNNPYLFAALSLGPSAVLRLLERLPGGLWDERLGEDRFTPREVVAHLADWEPILRERIQAGLERPGTPIVAFDEGERAIERAYASSEPMRQAQAFARERAETVALLKTVGARWHQTVEHPERGAMTVEDMANMLVGHDLYHVEQLAAHLR